MNTTPHRPTILLPSRSASTVMGRTEYDRADERVRTYRMQAYWYAVGFNYCRLQMTQGEADPINEEAFASWAEGAAEVYHVHRTAPGLLAVPDMFEAWQRQGSPS